MRAIRARYDPFEQARGRVDQIKALGHSVDKVEYIIMGGTFMSLPEDYRETFIAQLHNALSGYQTDKVDEAVQAVVKRLNLASRDEVAALRAKIEELSARLGQGGGA